jgi:hypothetical protein
MAQTQNNYLSNEFCEILQNSILKTLSTEPSALIGLKEELSFILQDILNKTRLGKNTDFDFSKKDINDVIILVCNPVNFTNTFANNLQTELKNKDYADANVKVDYLKKDWGGVPQKIKIPLSASSPRSSHRSVAVGYPGCYAHSAGFPYPYQSQRPLTAGRTRSSSSRWAG